MDQWEKCSAAIWKYLSFLGCIPFQFRLRTEEGRSETDFCCKQFKASTPLSLICAAIAFAAVSQRPMFHHFQPTKGILSQRLVHFLRMLSAIVVAVVSHINNGVNLEHGGGENEWRLQWEVCSYGAECDFCREWSKTCIFYVFIMQDSLHYIISLWDSTYQSKSMPSSFSCSPYMFATRTCNIRKKGN